MRLTLTLYVEVPDGQGPHHSFQNIIWEVGAAGAESGIDWDQSYRGR